MADDARVRITAFTANRVAAEDMDAFGEAWRVASEPEGVVAVLFVMAGTPDAERLVRERMERYFSRAAQARDRDHSDDCKTWLRSLRVGYTRLVLPLSFPEWTVWEQFGWITATYVMPDA